MGVDTAHFFFLHKQRLLIAQSIKETIIRANDAIR
jgi:hypothetical protein